jgi:hypothetical protein
MLDFIMQAMVEYVDDWFLSIISFFFQLAGIIEPNDGQCHMTNNEYTHSDKQVSCIF